MTELRERPVNVYHKIVVRLKANLDILWLRDQSLEDTDLSPFAKVAAETVESLEAAMDQFRDVEQALHIDG